MRASNFVAAVWWRITYMCDAQASHVLYFKSVILDVVSVLLPVCFIQTRMIQSCVMLSIDWTVYITGHVSQCNALPYSEEPLSEINRIHLKYHSSSSFKKPTAPIQQAFSSLFLPFSACLSFSPWPSHCILLTAKASSMETANGEAFGSYLWPGLEKSSFRWSCSLKFNQQHKNTWLQINTCLTCLVITDC